MKAFGNNGKGEFDIITLPLPSPGSGKVLIQVMAAGVNRADLLQKKGKYPPPPGASDILGMEVSGKIAAIGSNVVGFSIGDDVCALLEGGGYAEYAVVSATQALPIPKGFDYIKAAAIPEVAFTVWNNLFDIARLKKGEKLLVHGGASGIGVMAIQMAKAFGIECYATAGSDDKCKFIEKLGAMAINYKTEYFVQKIKAATASYGVDVVLDIVGGEYFQKNLDVMAYHGRLVCISFLGGARAEVNFAPMLLKNLSIMGTTLRNKTTQEKADIAVKLKNNIWPLLENGSILPVIHRVVALEEVEKAHQIMQSNENIGKIILKL